MEKSVYLLTQMYLTEVVHQNKLWDIHTGIENPWSLGDYVVFMRKAGMCSGDMGEQC